MGVIPLLDCSLESRCQKEKSATLTSREVWTLSSDGKTLTKRIHRTGSRGNDSDQTYVLVKQD